MSLREGNRWSVVAATFIFAGLLGLCTRNAAAQGNLLVNGSFEEPSSASSPYPWGYTYGVIPGSPSYAGANIPGWMITRGTIDLYLTGWPAAAGSQSIDLVGSPGAATIQQTFATIPGRDYIFSGFVSHNPGVAYGRASVTLNGVPFVQLFSSVASSSTDMMWAPFAYRFRATSPTTTLALSDVTGLSDVAGTALDALSVTLSGTSGEPNSAILQIVGDGSEATLSVGQCVSLNLRVRFVGTEEYVDLTSDPHTTFSTNPTRGSFTGSTFCAGAGDANKSFTIYGRYRDPVSGISATGTVSIHVKPTSG